MALIRLGKFQDAARELERVARLDPEFPGAVATAARARAWAGDRERALALLGSRGESPDEDLQALGDSLVRAGQSPAHLPQ